MNPINNSDTAWLIITDYNQDNDIPYEDLKEDILNPNTNQFYYENLYQVEIVGTNMHGIQSNTIGFAATNTEAHAFALGGTVGWDYGHFVGGNRDTHQ